MQLPRRRGLRRLLGALERSRVFQRLTGEANVPVIPFHYLRHAFASWLLGAGMDVVAVSERLGHWSPSLTLSVYAHAIRGRQRELARTIGAALKEGNDSDMIPTRDRSTSAARIASPLVAGTRGGSSVG